MSAISVMLVDDNPSVRAGIRSLLERVPGIQVIAEASNGGQALHLLDNVDPDVLVLDMEMPGINGVQVAQTLQESGSDLPILALSAHEDKHFIIGMLSIGASGYLVKDEVPEMIVRAVKGVAGGEHGWVSGRIAMRLALWAANEDPSFFELSPLDIRIIQLQIDSRPVSEISRLVGKPAEYIQQRVDCILNQVRQFSEVGFKDGPEGE